MKRIVYTVLKKLPLILAVVVAPLTLFLILHLRPEFLEFLRLPESDDKPQKKRALSVDTATDWEREAARCSTAEDFNRLARKAWEAGRGSLADEFYKNALSVDPENETAHGKLGHSRFDAEEALVEFKELLPFIRDDEVSGFTKLQGQWLNAGETIVLEARWKVTRRTLVARRDRARALEESLGAAAWTAMKSHGLFGKFIDSWNYRVDRTRPPFVFIIEGDESQGKEPASAFLDTLANDLRHMLARFRAHWLPAPAEAGDMDDYGTFHVFVLGDRRRTAAQAVHFSRGRARHDSVSFFDEATGMLVASLPEDRILYSGSGPSRRAMIEPFGRAILKNLCPEPMPLWLNEGIARLLSMGSGFEQPGKLRVSGDGIVNWKTFLSWLDAGISADRQEAFRLWSAKSDADWIPWPLPLEALTACDSIDSMGQRCATDGPLADTLEVCALLCHYLDSVKELDFVGQYARPHLAGRSPVSDLGTLLEAHSFRSIEREMIKRYTSGLGRGELIKKIAEGRFPKKADLETRPARHTPTVEKIPYFDEDALLGLVNKEMHAELYRAFVVYLAGKHGLCPTESLLRGRLGQPGTAAGAIEKEWRALHESARFLDSKLDALGAARFSYRLDGVDVRLEGTNEKGLVWKRLDSQATIVTPHSALPLEYAVSRFKKVLAPTTDEDRLAYCRLFAFTADSTRFRKELGGVAQSGPARDDLKELHRLYTEAEAGAAMITVLSGERSGSAREVIDFFTKQVRRIEDRAAFADAVGKNRHDRIVKAILRRTYTDDDRYLWDRFKGFEGSEGDRVRFYYDFMERDERRDFDLRPFPLAEALKKARGVEKVLAPRSFQIKNDSLVAYGSDFIRIEPLFAGDMAIKVSFSFAPKRENNLSKPFYLCFGQTPENGEGYLSSACLKGIDINGRLIGAAAGAPGTLACPSDLAVNKTYSATLSSAAGQAAHTFRSTRVATPDGLAGRRRGQVFIWVHGPRWFHIEDIEVEAAIDQAWLDGRIAPLVEEDFEKIMN